MGINSSRHHADEELAAWHMPWHNDEQLVRLVAYEAFAAVDHVESALVIEALSMSLGDRTGTERVDTSVSQGVM